MRRRRFLLAGTAAALAGCLSRPGAPRQASPDDPLASTTTTGERPATVRKTADGVAATFAVLDGHRPTPDRTRATFEGRRVTVTGTMDPRGCNRPVLASVGYDRAVGEVSLVLAGESPYGETATVECGNASYDYRSVVTVDAGRPTAVAVTHDYASGDDRTVTLERGGG